MYIPSDFQENDRSRIDDIISHIGFGCVTSNMEGQLFATHIPFLVYRRHDPSERRLILFGHMSNSNQQLESIRRQERLLIIFQGWHAYVSPSWYANPGVPTWNYVAVHIHGTGKTIADPEQLADLLAEITEKYECTQPDPWSIQKLTAEHRRKALQSITGFTVICDEIQAKFKLSQNKKPEDQKRVIEHFKKSASEDELVLAAIMEENLTKMRE